MTPQSFYLSSSVAALILRFRLGAVKWDGRLRHSFTALCDRLELRADFLLNDRQTKAPKRFDHAFDILREVLLMDESVALKL